MRGVLLLWDMLVLGTRMMLFASSVALPDDETNTASAVDKSSSAQSKPLPTAEPGTVAETNGALQGVDARLIVTLIFSLAFALALFFLAPLGVVSLVSRWLPNDWSGLVLEGVLRLGLLIGYLWLIGRLPEIQRVFAYHGRNTNRSTRWRRASRSMSRTCGPLRVYTFAAAPDSC